MKLRTSSLALASAFALTVCGCSSFKSRWSAAPSMSADGVSGRWVGTWKNTNNAHGGPLQAVLISLGTNTFAAYFHAGWGKHSGTFKTPIQGEYEGESFRFQGSKRVFGLKINTAGIVRSDEFNATYESRFDSGTFTLSRPSQ